MRGNGKIIQELERDFRGVGGKNFDGRGNFAMGLKEQIVFPEIDYDRVDAIRGMDIVVVTTAKTDAEAKALTENLGPPPLTRARHRAALQQAARFLRAAGDENLPELRAENMRAALRSFGSITGSVGIEDLLDTIFRQFCIGK